MQCPWNIEVGLGAPGKCQDLGGTWYTRVCSKDPSSIPFRVRRLTVCCEPLLLPAAASCCSHVPPRCLHLAKQVLPHFGGCIPGRLRRATRRRCIHALRVCRRTWENSWIRQRRGGERRTIAQFVSGIFTAHQGAPRAPQVLAPGQASFAPLWGMHSGPTSALAARRRCIHALRACRRTWENSWIRQRGGGERRTIAHFVFGIFTAHQGAPQLLLLPVAATGCLYQLNNRGGVCYCALGCTTIPLGVVEITLSWTPQMDS